MSGDASRICPDCRREMVEITRGLSWGREREGEGAAWEEEENPLFGPAAEAEEEERTWECPQCGRREYRKTVISDQ